jgi:hypothetical protein
VLLPSDLLIDPGRTEFSSTNLNTASGLRLHKLATVHASMIVRYLGRLDAEQRVVITREPRDMLQL